MLSRIAALCARVARPLKPVWQLLRAWPRLLWARASPWLQARRGALAQALRLAYQILALPRLDKLSGPSLWRAATSKLWLAAFYALKGLGAAALGLCRLAPARRPRAQRLVTRWLLRARRAAARGAAPRTPALVPGAKALTGLPVTAGPAAPASLAARARARRPLPRRLWGGLTYAASLLLRAALRALSGLVRRAIPRLARCLLARLLKWSGRPTLASLCWAALVRAVRASLWTFVVAVALALLALERVGTALVYLWAHLLLWRWHVAAARQRWAWWRHLHRMRVARARRAVARARACVRALRARLRAWVRREPPARPPTPKERYRSWRAALRQRYLRWRNARLLQIARRILAFSPALFGALVSLATLVTVLVRVGRIYYRRLVYRMDLALLLQVIPLWSWLVDAWGPFAAHLYSISPSLRATRDYIRYRRATLFRPWWWGRSKDFRLVYRQTRGDPICILTLVYVMDLAPDEFAAWEYVHQTNWRHRRYLRRYRRHIKRKIHLAREARADEVLGPGLWTLRLYLFALQHVYPALVKWPRTARAVRGALHSTRGFGLWVVATAPHAYDRAASYRLFRYVAPCASLGSFGAAWGPQRYLKRVEDLFWFEDLVHRLGRQGAFPYATPPLGSWLRLQSQDVWYRAHLPPTVALALLSGVAKPALYVGAHVLTWPPVYFAVRAWRSFTAPIRFAARLAYQWPTRGRRAPYTMPLDLPAVYFLVWATFIKDHRGVPKPIRKKAARILHACWRIPALVAAVSLGLGVAWFLAAPVRGVRGLVSLSTTPWEPRVYDFRPAKGVGSLNRTPTLGSAIAWAVGRVRRYQSTGRDLWVWCLHGLGHAHGAWRPVGAVRPVPPYLDPRWAFPFKGKYDRYDYVYWRPLFTYRRLKGFSHYVLWNQLGDVPRRWYRRGALTWTEYVAPRGFLARRRGAPDLVPHIYSRIFWWVWGYVRSYLPDLPEAPVRRFQRRCARLWKRLCQLGAALVVRVQPYLTWYYWMWPVVRWPAPPGPNVFHPFNKTPWGLVLHGLPGQSLKGWYQRNDVTRLGYVLGSGSLWRLRLGFQAQIWAPLKAFVRAHLRVYTPKYANPGRLFRSQAWTHLSPMLAYKPLGTNLTALTQGGFIRPTLTPLTVLRHVSRMCRLVILTYKATHVFWPWAREHLWLSWGASLACWGGWRPSLVYAPGAAWADFDGVTPFLGTLLRVARLGVWSVTTPKLWPGALKPAGADHDLAAWAAGQIDAGPSHLLSEVGSTSFGTGMGGYWGPDQTGGLVDPNVGIRKNFLGLENPNPAAARLRAAARYAAERHPTGAQRPLFEQSLSTFWDRLAVNLPPHIEGPLGTPMQAILQAKPYAFLLQLRDECQLVPTGGRIGGPLVNFPPSRAQRPFRPEAGALEGVPASRPRFGTTWPPRSPASRISHLYRPHGTLLDLPPFGDSLEENVVGLRKLAPYRSPDVDYWRYDYWRSPLLNRPFSRIPFGVQRRVHIVRDFQTSSGVMWKWTEPFGAPYSYYDCLYLEEESLPTPVTWKVLDWRAPRLLFRALQRDPLAGPGLRVWQRPLEPATPPPGFRFGRPPFNFGQPPAWYRPPTPFAKGACHPNFLFEPIPIRLHPNSTGRKAPPDPGVGSLWPLYYPAPVAPRPVDPRQIPRSGLAWLHRRGGRAAPEVGPDLRSYWARCGAYPYAETALGLGRPSVAFPPTHTHHLADQAWLDLFTLVRAWGGGLGSMLSWAFAPWAGGAYALGLLGALALVPCLLARCLWSRVLERASHAGLPPLRLPTKLEPVEGLDPGPDSGLYLTLRELLKYSWEVACQAGRALRWLFATGGLPPLFAAWMGGILGLGNFCLDAIWYAPNVPRWRSAPFWLNAYEVSRPRTPMAHNRLSENAGLPTRLALRARDAVWGLVYPLVPLTLALETYLRPRPPLLGPVVEFLGRHRERCLTAVPGTWGRPRLYALNKPHIPMPVDSHFKIPVWVLQLLFPHIEWRWSFGYLLKPYRAYGPFQSVFWINEFYYGETVGHTYANGDYNQWHWAPYRAFSGTLLAWFGYNLPTYGRIELRVRSMAQWLAGAERPVNHMFPDSLARMSSQGARELWWAVRDLNLYARSPMSLVYGHFPEDWTRQTRAEGYLFFIFDAVARASLALARSLPTWATPYWSGFLVPQPEVPHFPDPSDLPEADYVDLRKRKWKFLYFYLLPYLRRLHQLHLSPGKTLFYGALDVGPINDHRDVLERRRAHAEDPVSRDEFFNRVDPRVHFAWHWVKRVLFWRHSHPLYRDEDRTPQAHFPPRDLRVCRGQGSSRVLGLESYNPTYAEFCEYWGARPRPEYEGTPLEFK